MSPIPKRIAEEVVRLTSEEIEHRFHGDPDGMRKAIGAGWNQTARLVVGQAFESNVRGTEVDIAIHLGAVSGRELQERDRRWAAKNKELNRP